MYMWYKGIISYDAGNFKWAEFKKIQAKKTGADL